VQLLPDPLVGPVRDVVVRVDLDVEPAQLGRSEAVQREAALVRGVDQFVRGRRDLGQDAEPAERVLARAVREDAVGDGVAADAVEAVAAGDRPAAELVVAAVVAVADGRGPGIGGDVLDLEQQRLAGRAPRRDQVLHDLLLAVDHDRAADQLLEVDPVPLAVVAQLDPLVDRALAVHPLADARLAQGVHRALLEHAGAHALDHVLLVAVLEHDRLDPVQVQEMREQQAGRAGADDADLGLYPQTSWAVSTIRRSLATSCS
jgi:hypothetical protein